MAVKIQVEVFWFQPEDGGRMSLRRLISYRNTTRFHNPENLDLHWIFFYKVKTLSERISAVDLKILVDNIPNSFTLNVIYV
jgi:hypothetical protein